MQGPATTGDFVLRTSGTQLAKSPVPLLWEVCVKSVTAALLIVLFAPSLAFAQADAGSTVIPVANSAEQTSPPPAPPLSPPPGTPGTGTSGAGTAPAAAPAAGQSALANAVQARTPEEQAKQSGFQFAFGLDHYLGTGTFVNPQLYASLIAAPSVSATYLFGVGGVRLAASARAIAFYEYTLPDSGNGRRFSPGDIRLGLVAPALFQDKALTKIALTPSVGLVVPASPESFTAGLITSISVGLAASRSISTKNFGGFDFRLTAGASKGVFTSRQNGLGPSQRDSLGLAVVLCRPNELVCVSNGANPAFSLSIGGSANWRATGNLIVFAGYTYTRTFRESLAAIGDETIPKTLDSEGSSAARVGLGALDLTRTFLGVSYQLNEHYNLDFYVFTEQNPLTPQRQVRFPLLSLNAWATNNTSLIVSLGAAY